MKNRYKKLVYVDERGITFEVNAKEGIILRASEGTSGELIIRALNITTDNACSQDNVFNNPPIPDGYKHVCGEWHNGFVIERCSDASQFVWIPVGYLDADGTLDGEHFTEKFGRRNYRKDNYECNEPLEGELLEQFESVKKYGGFYISRYNISESQSGKPQSVKGVMPWVKIPFNEAKKVAADFENSKLLKSHLTYGAEYDSVLAWLIKSGAKTLNQIAMDSTEWGKYVNTENSPRRIVATGSREKWCANNIYDFAGNVVEWTQERHKYSYLVVRGGGYDTLGFFGPAACRGSNRPDDCYDHTGFRVTLYIK